MSIFTDPTPLVLPHQLNGAGAANATRIEEYTGMVEQVIKRKCLSMKLSNFRTVRGTDTISKRSSGKSTVQKIVPGTAPAGTTHEFGRNRLVVDTALLTREAVHMIEQWQQDFDAKSELSEAQGEAHARALDQAFFIAALKSARATTSPYGTTGFLGGTQGTLATANKTDPVAIYAAINKLLRDMSKKDVSPQEDGISLFMGQDQFYALLMADEVVNRDYITANGTRIEGQPFFKTFGVPIFATNNAPFETNVTAHVLSNAANSNFYNGDFTSSVILAASPKAVLAGQTCALTTKIWHSDEYLADYVDAYTMYGMTIDRPEYAGVIELV